MAEGPRLFPKGSTTTAGGRSGPGISLARSSSRARAPRRPPRVATEAPTRKVRALLLGSVAPAVTSRADVGDAATSARTVLRPPLGPGLSGPRARPRPD